MLNMKYNNGSLNKFNQKAQQNFSTEYWTSLRIDPVIT